MTPSGNASTFIVYEGAGALAVDAAGDLYVAYNNGIGEVDPEGYGIGNFGVSAYGLAVDPEGNLYASNPGINTITKLTQTIDATTRLTIQSSVESRLMNIGGTNINVVNGINLTSTELTRLIVASGGTIVFGDTNQTGNITFSGAGPTNYTYVEVEVLQSPTGPGQVVLQEPGPGGIALNDINGLVSISPGTGNILAEVYPGNSGEPLSAATFYMTGLTIDFALQALPTADSVITAVYSGGLNGPMGTFSNIPPGSVVAIDEQGYSLRIQHQLTAPAPRGQNLLLRYSPLTMITSSLPGAKSPSPIHRRSASPAAPTRIPSRSQPAACHQV